MFGENFLKIYKNDGAIEVKHLKQSPLATMLDHCLLL